MDIYQRLQNDHDQQKELAKRLAETSGASDERIQLWDRLKAAVEAHAAAEEQTFYATLLEHPEGQQKARHSVAEHKEAADLIEELSDSDQSSSGWLQKFKKLHDELEHHIKEEENEVFRLARSLLSEEQAKQLAQKFDQRKKAELNES